MAILVVCILVEALAKQQQQQQQPNSQRLVPCHPPSTTHTHRQHSGIRPWTNHINPLPTLLADPIIAPIQKPFGGACLFCSCLGCSPAREIVRLSCCCSGRLSLPSRSPSHLSLLFTLVPVPTVPPSAPTTLISSKQIFTHPLAHFIHFLSPRPCPPCYAYFFSSAITDGSALLALISRLPAISAASFLPLSAVTPLGVRARPACFPGPLRSQRQFCAVDCPHPRHHPTITTTRDLSLTALYRPRERLQNSLLLGIFRVSGLIYSHHGFIVIKRRRRPLPSRQEDRRGLFWCHFRRYQSFEQPASCHQICKSCIVHFPVSCLCRPCRSWGRIM